jgi:hypothetical protein
MSFAALFQAIAATARAQRTAGTSPFTEDQVRFLEDMGTYGLGAPMASQVIASRLLAQLPPEARVGDLQVHEVQRVLQGILTPPLSAPAWPEEHRPEARPPFDPGMVSWALGRLDATFAFSHTGAHAQPAHAYAQLRQAFLPLTECSPNPYGPDFASVPAALTVLDAVFLASESAPAAMAYGTLRAACFASRAKALANACKSRAVEAA